MRKMLMDREIVRHLVVDFAAAAVGVAIVALPMLFAHAVMA